MKRIVTFVFALLLSFNIKAQTSLTEAVNFNSVALNGEQIDLFEILDNGQYALIEFFYSGTSGALTYVYKMTESYEYFGCNQHDVYYMQISRYDDENEARDWCNEYEIKFPTIHTESEGDSGDEICQMYGIPSYPTLVLIAPNHEIVLQDIWPVMYVEDIINALLPFGIEQHECSEIMPEIYVHISQTTSTSVTAEFTPNLTCVSYHYILSEGNSLENQELPIEQVIVEQGMEQSGNFTYSWNDLEPETDYTIYALPKDLEGTFGELKIIPFTTEAESCMELKDKTFKMTPNPARSTVNIYLDSKAQIKIFDISGRCVKEVDVINSTTINVEDLDKGIYFVNANGMVEKLVVE